MMAMAKGEPMPTWRNFAAWSLVGAIFILALWGGIWLLRGDGMSATFPSKKVAAILGLALIFAMVVTGFTGRKRPVSLRSFRNYVILNAVAFALFLSAIWGFGALGGAGALGVMSASKWVAAVLGSVLIITLSSASSPRRALTRAPISSTTRWLPRTCANAAGSFSTAWSGWPLAACG